MEHDLFSKNLLFSLSISIAHLGFSIFTPENLRYNKAEIYE